MNTPTRPELRALAEDVLAQNVSKSHRMGRFHSAADPATVIALLDALDRAERDAERLASCLAGIGAEFETFGFDCFIDGFPKCCTASIAAHVANRAVAVGGGCND